MWQRGFSLIEVMLSLLLSTIIMTGLLSLYINQKRHFIWQQALLSMAEHGRVARFWLGTTVENSGYLGYARAQLSETLKKIKFITIYHASANHWQPVLPQYLKNKVVKGADVLHVSLSSDYVGYLIEDMQQKNNLLLYSRQNLKSQKRLLLVSPHYTDIVIPKKLWRVSKQVYRATLQGSIQQLLPKQTEINAFQDIYFWIGRTSRKNQQGKIIYALYMAINNKQREELVPGIVKMHIDEIIRNTNGNVNYTTKSTWLSGQKVLAVAFTLTLQSHRILPETHTRLQKKYWFVVPIYNSF